MTANESKRQIRILVAEDYATNRDIISAYLAGDQYAVAIAENGRKVVEVFQGGEPYDLILMDVEMPVMDGYAATRGIRELEQESYGQGGRKRKTAIIGMTAHVTKEDRERCLQAGMDDYISKPFRKKELLAIVAKWVGLQSG
jgi:CheY-like chemotaxis protein